MHKVVLLKLCLDNDQLASLDELKINPCKDVMVGYRQWCSLCDTQVYGVYPLGKAKDLRIPT